MPTKQSFCKRTLFLALIIGLSTSMHSLVLAHNPSTYGWDFPLSKTYDGILFGNSRMGAIIWGQGNILRITIGRADFWDHQGGYPFTREYTYDKMRRIIEHGHKIALYKKMNQRRKNEIKPSVLPLGRVELNFGSGYRLIKGILHMDKGFIEIFIQTPQGRKEVHLAMDMSSPMLGLQLDEGLSPKIRNVTCWDFEATLNGSRPEEPGLLQRHIPRPKFFDSSAISGWIQGRPVDPPLALGYRLQKQKLFITTAIDSTNKKARNKALVQLDHAFNEGFSNLQERTSDWWKRYWNKIPTIHLPDKDLMFLYNYGMYKFGAASKPGGVPITLQGPWIQVYRMPPWLNDYHFDINVEMSYWPAYQGNQLSHLLPLFHLINTWIPKLQKNGQEFYGISNTLELPHAVDDNGTRLIPLVNNGYMNPANSAWVAIMMYRYYRYSMDIDFLRYTAYPFMKQSFNTYAAILEKEGDHLVLQEASSPEYYSGQSGSNGTGKNSSYQLTVLHQLTDDLIKAAQRLNMQPDPYWKEVQKKLPLVTVINQKIAIWKDQPLAKCHRHFSHLSGIYPFDIFPKNDAKWKMILDNSMHQLTKKGIDCWAGWSYGWASILNTRLGNAKEAVKLLKIWEKKYTGKGYGTFTNPVGKYAKMTLEGGFGVTAAIQQMLLFQKRGIHYLFKGIPKNWQNISFTNMLTGGAFLVSSKKEDGEVTQISVKSQAGGTIRIHNPWDSKFIIDRNSGQTVLKNKKVIQIQIPENQQVTMRPAL